MEALMARITALEEDNARRRAEIDELRERVNALQTGTPGGPSPVDTETVVEAHGVRGKRGELDPGSH